MPLEIKDLLGIWEFLSSKMTDVNGREFLDPFNKAAGCIIYTDNNYMSVQLYIPKDNVLDKHLTFEPGYLAYYGNYYFNQKKQIIDHHVKNSNIAELTGNILKRKIKYYTHINCISLQNIEPEKFGMAFPIYRELFWRKL